MSLPTAGFGLGWRIKGLWVEGTASSLYPALYNPNLLGQSLHKSVGKSSPADKYVHASVFLACSGPWLEEERELIADHRPWVQQKVAQPEGPKCFEEKKSESAVAIFEKFTFKQNTRQCLLKQAKSFLSSAELLELFAVLCSPELSITIQYLRF